MFDEPLTGDMTIRAIAEPVPFSARLVAGSSADRVEFDIDLMPATPPDEWDAMLAGRYGGLHAALRLHWFVEKGRGESRFDFEYRPSKAPRVTEARAISWICAARRDGTMRIEDRTGDRPSTEMRTAPQPVPTELTTWAQIHADLADLESASGQSAPQPPNEVTLEDFQRIATVAAMLRACRHPAGVRDFAMTLGPDAPLVPRVGSIVKNVRSERSSPSSLVSSSW
jgi:hypothetical protein